MKRYIIINVATFARSPPRSLKSLPPRRTRRPRTMGLTRRAKSHQLTPKTRRRLRKLKMTTPKMQMRRRNPLLMLKIKKRTAQRRRP